MGIGIMVCGLNGSGKSTFGRALADKLGFFFIDNEHLFFDRSSNDEPYANPRSHEDAIELLMDNVLNNPDFVFAAVKGDYGKDIIPLYNYVIVIEVPKEMRLERVRNRSYSKFGARMLKGGDLYEQEENFFRFIESRENDYVDNWIETLSCVVLRVDGTKPVEENISYILSKISH